MEQLSETVENMISLSYINLHNTNLYGKIPSKGGFCKISATTKVLESVDLSKNQISGVVPSCLIGKTPGIRSGNYLKTTKHRYIKDRCTTKCKFRPQVRTAS